MRSLGIALACSLLTVGVVVLVALGVFAQDNHTPETAAPLEQHNYITEYLNATNDSLEYWYYMDIDRGDELFVYFYGTGEPYHACRMLYYMRGPGTYDEGTDVLGEYWYRQKQSRNDRSDLEHWICPKRGRYYFHFYAIGNAVGDFHCNVSRDTPPEIHAGAVDGGTLWWGGVQDQNKNDVWKIWLEPDDENLEGVEVTVSWTYDHRVHLYAYDLVDEYYQNLLNLSYAHAGDRSERIRFTSSYAGWYFIRVEYGSWSGSEDYTIRTRAYSAPNDGDNTPENATHVKKTSTLEGRLEASRDMHDWYSVDLYKGDLLGISMQIDDPYNPDNNPGAPNFRNFFEIQVYDPYMRRVNNGYDANGGWPVPDTFINNLPIQPQDIQVNGTYHIRASFSYSSGYWYDPVNTSGHIIAFCKYDLQITIPNRPPLVNATALEDVWMLEDTTWWENLAGENVSSLDLGTVFRDPEDGVMTFFVSGDPNVTARLMDDEVTLKPRADWHGQANVSLRAEDDGGNSVRAVLHVVVVPVNDRPRKLTDHLELGFEEDDPSEDNRTVNLYDLFYDVDEEDADALSFEWLPDLGGDRLVQVDIDDSTGNVTVTPVADYHGQVSLDFVTTDTHGAKAEGTVRLTVSPVNDGPKVRSGVAEYAFAEGFMLETFDAADWLYDPDGDTELRWLLSYFDPTDEANLSVNNEGRDPANSVMVVTPARNRNDWFGGVPLVITCQDPGGLQGTKAVLIVIVNTPDPPEVYDWSPRADVEVTEGSTQAFEIVTVRDPDGENAVLHYSFLVKGPEDPVAREVQNTTNGSFVFAPDFESEGGYHVRCVVFDEDLLPCVTPVDWEVTVTKSNRPPQVTILAPDDNQTFKKGEWVEFSASATDPDTEDIPGLVVEWYDGDVLLGTGPTYSVRKLKKGTHVISAAVTDSGGLSSEEAITISVKEVDEGPGFGPVLAVLALLVACFLGAMRVKGRS